MRALSIRQPWAELILSGAKTIETRKWNTSLRGEFFIHAAQAADGQSMNQFGFTSLPRGCIVGRARVVEVKRYETLAAFVADEQRHCVHIAPGSAWLKPRYGFVLADVHRIEPVACKGMLNFFPLPDAVAKRLSPRAPGRSPA